MATVNPIVTIVGELRGLRQSEFRNNDTGEINEKVTASVLTRQGFIDVSVPVRHRPFPRSEGDLVILECEVLTWFFNGKHGTSFLLDDDVTDRGLVVPAELAGAKK